QVEYTGVDFAPAMIEAARLRHPELNLILTDALDSDSELPESDYVLASGLFSYVDEDTWREAVPRLYGICRRAFAFNVLNRLSPEADPDGFALDPDEALAYCRTLAPESRLRTDYLPNDFTIYMNREG